MPPLQLFPPLLTPHLFLSSSQLFSPSQLWPTLLNSSHLLSQRCLDTQSKLLHGGAFTHSKLLHRETFTHRSFYTQQAFPHSKLLHREAFTHSKLSHGEAFTQRSSYTEQAFLQSKLLHREAFTQSKLLHTAKFYTEKLHIKFLHKEKLLHREAFTQSKLFHSASLCTEKLLHREAFTQSKLLQRIFFLHREDFAQSKLFHRANFCTEKLLHTASFYTEKLLHKASFYTEKLLHKARFYTEELLHKASFCTEKLLHTASFYTEKLLHKASYCTEKLLHSKLLHREAATQDAPKLRNICCQSTIRNLHATTFYNLRFKSILHAAAAARNLDAAIPRRSAETELQSTQESRTTATQTAAPKPDLDAQAERRRFWSTFKRNFKGKSPAPKWEKIAAKAPFATFMLPLQCDLRLSAGKYYACTRSSEPWRSYSTAICRGWVAKHDRITHNSYANCSSKTGSRRPSGKTTILKHFLKGI